MVWCTNVHLVANVAWNHPVGILQRCLVQRN